MKKHYRKENNCLNCDTTLQGPFCHVCGQENLQIKESFGHMMNHAISDYFHFDQKFFHTLKPLFFKPGLLTNEYMAGRRAQYLHPVKMYIFISLVYFLLVFQQNNDVVKVNVKTLTIEQVNATVAAIRQNSYIPAKAKEEAINDVYRKYGYIIVNKRVVKDTSKKTRDRLAEEQRNPGLMNPTTTDTTYAQYLASQQKLPEARRDGWFERYYNKKALAVKQQKINIKDAMGEGIKHNFPKMMFVLLPLFALILMITFRRSKKYYVEHLIYAFHLHCFIFLFLSVLLVLKMIAPASWDTAIGWMSFAAVIAIIWYIYRSLRVVYQRSRWRTITKMIGMSFTYCFVFCICMALMVIITAATVV